MDPSEYRSATSLEVLAASLGKRLTRDELEWLWRNLARQTEEKKPKEVVPQSAPHRERSMMVNQTPTTVTVEKPWGKFERYTHNLPSTVKVITVRPGAALSLQYHSKRDELWVVLDPGVQVEVGDRILKPEAEGTVFIPRRTPHRLSAIGKEPVRVLEISVGEFDEEDIVRLEDVYGRVEIANTT